MEMVFYGFQKESAKRVVQNAFNNIVRYSVTLNGTIYFVSTSSINSIGRSCKNYFTHALFNFYFEVILPVVTGNIFSLLI